jgi:hypothetical protein
MTRISAVVFAAAIVVGSVAGAVGFDAVDRAAEVDQPGERLGPPMRALVLGDSALASLRWAPGAANAVVGFEHTLDLETCRRLYTLSCPGRTGAPPPTAYEALAAYGDVYDTLVLAVGYNEFPAYMAESFQRVVERARSLGYRRIVWWTLRNRGLSTNAGRNDMTVRELVAGGGYDDVVIADWAVYSASHPEWFNADGVHHQLAGAYAAADYLSRKLAAVEGRPCPLPDRPGEATPFPCPDPDRLPPTSDLASLYAIGSEAVICYERWPDEVRCQHRGLDMALDRSLAPGATGLDVEALQHRLRRLGLLATITGRYDGPTESAVRVAQTERGVAVSGRADRHTLARLGFDVGGIP